MNKLIIPSAGKATRFYEISKSFPKALLPYRNKPILLHIIEPYLKKFDQISVVIKDYYSQYSEIVESYKISNVEIIEVDESYIQGPATSIFCGLSGEESEITILLSDAIYDLDITKIKKDSISAMEVNDYTRWCMVDENLNFFDKPKTKPKTNLAVSGIYKFSDPKLFFNIAENYIEGTLEETQISNILKNYNDEKKLALYKHDKEKFIDFGNVQSYIKNKNIPISRNFNSIEFKENTVKKYSISNPEKIIKEGLWMQNFPIKRESIPRVLNIDYLNGIIEMEYVSGYTLRELMMYYDNTEETWSKIFNLLLDFKNECSSEIFSTNLFWDSVIQKTIRRNENINSEFIVYFTGLLSNSKIYNESTLFHGDLVFSNIIYEPIKGSLKYIDPNGNFYGHWAYDLSKVGQSVLGNYDLIDSEMYIFEDKFFKIFSTKRDQIQKLYFQYFEREIDLIGEKLLYGLIASLYLSLIPLHDHSEKNQKLYMEEFNRFYEMSLEL